MRDKEVCGNVCLYRSDIGLSVSFRAIKLLWRRDLGEVLFAFSLLRVNSP